MKFLVVFAFIALAAAAENEEQSRDKRGVLGLGLGGYPAIGYAAPAIHAPIAPIALGYQQKIVAAPVVKYVAPVPAVKVIQPAYLPYAKLGYSSPLISSPYGYGLGHGYGYGSGYGYGHGHGLGLGYGYGGYLH